jgi:hypothetical protein
VSNAQPYGQQPGQYPEAEDDVPFGVPGEGSADDFEFGDVSFNRDAEAIEQDNKSRQYRMPPTGEWEFFVEGFFKAPEAVPRTGFFDGQEVTWTTFLVGVRLAMVSDPGATILDWFNLPPVNPTNPDEVYYYLNASSGRDGKNPGMMAEKLGHFLSRLGWPYTKGSPLPPEAKRLGNWKGRRVIATIGTQKPKKGEMPKVDPTTGLPYPPKLQVMLFSYRNASGTANGVHPATQQVQAAHATSGTRNQGNHPQGTTATPQDLQHGQLTPATPAPSTSGPGMPNSRLDQLRGRL